MAKKKPAKRAKKTKRGIARKKVSTVKAKPRTAKKTKPKSKKKSPELTLEKIGEVTHYFPHVKAAAVMILKDSLKVGDSIYIKGHTTDFKEQVKSIQLDRASIAEGKKGQEIGLLVKSRVRIGDNVYRM